MTEGHEMRWGGFAGLASLVLAIAAGILLTGAPRVTASSDAIALYLVESRGLIITAALLGTAALAMFVWFGATLATAFRQAQPNSDAPAVVLAGFTITGALGFLGASIIGGLTYAAAANPALLDMIAAPYTALHVMATIGGIAVALPLAASAIAIARTSVLPQWAGWLSALVAAVDVLAAITVLSGSGIWAPGSALTAYVPLGLTALWGLALSGLLIRERVPEIASRHHAVAGPA
ncbi:hypothetical protein [Saccharopolyspora griseoalba]|uniref:DUF4386 family protein n=1 Tax=Saccharopolyspora griseoalba TaxID=1431848 RepID=A0ABW2LQP6_9PSEU